MKGPSTVRVRDNNTGQFVSVLGSKEFATVDQTLRTASQESVYSRDEMAEMDQ